MKKLTSLILTLLILLSCMTFGASAQRDLSQAEQIAYQLKEIGLFKGVSDTDFALGRAPTRVEAMVMLIRVLGKEQQVSEGMWRHPFTDVPEWASKYVGFAYSQGLSNGISATEFGAGDASAAMYITFVLRSLGYSDANGDFTWNDPYALAEEVGILDERVDRENFLRADVAIVSHAALSSHLKGTETTLAQHLIAAGAFEKGKFDRVYKPYGETEQKEVLGAEQIYAKCSPAVFYIEILSENGELIGSGSGFFIDSKGTAVTNYHVIEAGPYAYAVPDGSEEKYYISGVYDYNKDEDWAVVKVDIAESKYLDLSLIHNVGEDVFAIGSPMGQKNSISTGIISKIDPEFVYSIQTTAPISHGSSGGALINKYGEVIGITSSSLEESQNVNFAVPVSLFIDYSVENFNLLTTFYLVSNGRSTTEYKHVAYSMLKGFIKNNDTDEYDFAYAYKDDSYENDVFELFYSDDADYIICSNAYTFDDGDMVVFAFFIPEDTAETVFYYKYDFFTENMGYVNAVTASGPLNIERFTYDTVLEFSNVEGKAGEGDLRFSTMMLRDTIAFINELYYEKLNELGKYTVYDLGFINYDIAQYYEDILNMEAEEIEEA